MDNFDRPGGRILEAPRQWRRPSQRSTVPKSFFLSLLLHILALTSTKASAIPVRDRGKECEGPDSRDQTSLTIENVQRLNRLERLYHVLTEVYDQGCSEDGSWLPTSRRKLIDKSGSLQVEDVAHGQCSIVESAPLYFPFKPLATLSIQTRPNDNLRILLMAFVPVGVRANPPSVPGGRWVTDKKRATQYEILALYTDEDTKLRFYDLSGALLSEIDTGHSEPIQQCACHSAGDPFLVCVAAGGSISTHRLSLYKGHRLLSGKQVKIASMSSTVDSRQQARNTEKSKDTEYDLGPLPTKSMRVFGAMQRRTTFRDIFPDLQGIWNGRDGHDMEAPLTALFAFSLRFKVFVAAGWSNGWFAIFNSDLLPMSTRKENCSITSIHANGNTLAYACGSAVKFTRYSPTKIEEVEGVCDLGRANEISSLYFDSLRPQILKVATTRGDVITMELQWHQADGIYVCNPIASLDNELLSSWKQASSERHTFLSGFWGYTVAQRESQVLVFLSNGGMEPDTLVGIEEFESGSLASGVPEDPASRSRQTKVVSATISDRKSFLVVATQTEETTWVIYTYSSRLKSVMVEGFDLFSLRGPVMVLGLGGIIVYTMTKQKKKAAQRGRTRAVPLYHRF